MENKQTGTTTVEEAKTLFFDGTKDLPAKEITKKEKFSLKDCGVDTIC